jgi:tektin-2
MALNKDCSSITYKVDPLRIPRNSCTYNGWLENCKELKLLTDKELKESYAVRESLFVSREKTKNLLHAQQEKTEHTIRRRIFETQRQRNELSWQKSKVSGARERKKSLNFCHLLTLKYFIKIFNFCSCFFSSPYLSISIRQLRNWIKLRAR